MPRQFRFLTGLTPAAPASLLTTALLLSGCADQAAPPATPIAAESGHGHDDGHDHDHDDGHDHPAEGPHHGDLVELGNEAYHAEIVHGDGGEVTIYILDGAAKAAVPISALSVAINLTHEGEAEQFQLSAAPQDSDPAGKSSRFVLKDEHLAEDLDANGTTAKLVVTFDGQQFTGKIEHHHDHDHDHDHDK